MIFLPVNDYHLGKSFASISAGVLIIIVRRIFFIDWYYQGCLLCWAVCKRTLRKSAKKRGLWTQAQTYCRQKHTDLATIETSEEMDRVMNTVSSAGYSFKFWTGLYSNIKWRWSDGFTGVFNDHNYWSPEDSFHSRSDQICMVSKGHDLYVSWSDSNCSSLLPFVCYHGKFFSET
uniref:C-type lectin domain-containing protein n=1 Tax=Oryzias melastigma TaxID=30732 RepID=A0A3B3CZ01_ORYME